MDRSQPRAIGTVGMLDSYFSIPQCNPCENTYNMFYSSIDCSLTHQSKIYIESHPLSQLLPLF